MNVRLYLIAARAFALARWRMQHFRQRTVIEDFQRRRLAKLQRYAAAAFPFYAEYGGRSFGDWPILDKATMTVHFAALNIGRYTAPTIRQALAEGEDRIGNHVIGQSTGTSGNRGYYVISDAERFVWLGTLLAKTIPDALFRRHRVALVLPNLSALYQSAHVGSRIELGFFDLSQGVDMWAERLRAFAADTIVAPPKVLRWLASGGYLNATHIFSGAEVLDPIDRSIIESATGRRVREIYMATEGLFGVSCPLGTLHLAEDVVHFEWAGTSTDDLLRSPIVTDFTRKTQALIRYRMNDLLRIDPNPCACGSALQAVTAIVGRADDIFYFSATDGRTITVTPDVIRNAIVDSASTINDFRATQTGPNTVEVTLTAGLPQDAIACVQQSMKARLEALGVNATIEVKLGINTNFDTKLRRVRRLYA